MASSRSKTESYTEHEGVTCACCDAPLKVKSTGRPRRFCSDDCRKRYHDEHNRASCEICGKTLGSSSMRRGVTRCKKHSIPRLEAEGRRALITALWRKGASLREIADELGTTINSTNQTIIQMRRAGYDLSYRYQVQDGRRLPGKAA